MIIDLKEDNAFLSRSLDKAKRDTEDLINVNMKLEQEFYDRKVESKGNVVLQKMDYELSLEVCFEYPNIFFK